MAKQIFFRALFFIVALIAAGCGKEESPAGGSGISLSLAQIEGTWRFDEVTVSAPILNPLRDELLGATVRYCCQNRATFNFANNGGEEISNFSISGNKIRFDSGYLDEQEMEVQELTATSKRATMALTSDDDGSIRVVGRATFRLSKVSQQ